MACRRRTIGLAARDKTVVNMFGGIRQKMKGPFMWEPMTATAAVAVTTVTPTMLNSCHFIQKDVDTPTIPLDMPLLCRGQNLPQDNFQPFIGQHKASELKPYESSHKDGYFHLGIAFNAYKNRNDLIETFEIDFDFGVFLVLFVEICQRLKDNHD